MIADFVLAPCKPDPILYIVYSSFLCDGLKPSISGRRTGNYNAHCIRHIVFGQRIGYRLILDNTCALYISVLFGATFFSLFRSFLFSKSIPLFSFIPCSERKLIFFSFSKRFSYLSLMGSVVFCKTCCRISASFQLSSSRKPDIFLGRCGSLSLLCIA